MFEKCPNCLRRVIKGSKYCTHCGEKMPIVVKEKRQKNRSYFKGAYFSNSKQVFKQYETYLLERLQNPIVSMKKSMRKQSFQFGLAQLMILILLNSLSIILSQGRVDTVGGAISSTFSILSGAIALQLGTLLSLSIALYIATNYIKKVPTTLRTILSRLGGLASSQLILSILLVLSVALRLNALYSVVLVSFVIVSLVNIPFYLFSIKNNSSIPDYYNVVITLGLFIGLQVVIYTITQRFSTNPLIYSEIMKQLFN